MKNFWTLAVTCDFLEGMAKLISGPTRITIENAVFKGSYLTHHVGISSTTSGEDFTLSLGRAQKVMYTPTGFVEHISSDERPLCEAPQSPEELAMIQAAQEREMAVLQAAKNVADAHRQAELLIENVDHKLNWAIQKFLHTGKGNVEASKVLEKGGIWASEDRTAAVACAELDKLYGVDTLNSGL